MRTASFLAAFAAVVLPAAPALADPDRWEIDPAHFSIVFNANHIDYGRTWGMFLKGEGSFVFDEDTKELSDLTVTIPADSVFSNDDRRDGHLRSNDFLGAEANPLITFVMTDATPATENTGTITGDLTLRGVTKPVTLDVTLNKIGPYPWGSNYVLGVTATTTIMRSDFGMTYALEGNLVGDDIPLTFEIEAIRVEGEPS